MDVSDGRSPREVEENRRRSIGFTDSEKRKSINYHRRRSSTHSPNSNGMEPSLKSGSISARDEGKDDGDSKMEEESEDLRSREETKY